MSGKKIPEQISKHPKNLSLEELREFFTKLGHKPFRANQLYKWWHLKGATDFAEMTDVSKELRENLAEKYQGKLLKLVKTVSSADGSEKFVFETLDGKRLEAVFLPEGERRTLCVSTQIGCAMGCRFCRTGEMGFIRDLATAEILEQVYLAEKRLIEKPGVKLSNLVFMGMGEPLMNYDNTVKSIKMLTDEKGRNISHRHITVSTAGVTPAIKKFAADLPKIGLAVSLNAPNAGLRRKLMPIEKEYPLDELVKTLGDLKLGRGRRVTIEYVLLEEVNDSLAEAKELCRLLNRVKVKINLIPFNQTGGEYKKPSGNRIHKFQEYLIQQGFSVFIRTSKGDDVSAACGMLGGDAPE